MKTAMQALSAKIEKTKRMLESEEATKMALIIPMLSALGYDATDPFEVTPEMNCDLVKARGEKIDYAIRINGKVEILIECKHHSCRLELHTSQIEKYFVASDAKIAILTNGKQYNFYTDVIKRNIMDKIPFFAFDVQRATDEDIQHLTLFKKENFNPQTIRAMAQNEIEYKQTFECITRELDCPSDDLARMIYRKATSSTASISGNKLSAYKKTISKVISDIMSDQADESSDSLTFQEDDQHKEEIQICNEIANLLSKEGYNKFFIEHFKHYTRLSHKRSFLWFCRIYFNGWDKAYISFYDPVKLKGEYNKTKITSLKDIEGLKNHFVASIKANAVWQSYHNKN